MEQSIVDLIRHLDNKKDEAIVRTFKMIAKEFSKAFSELVPEGKAKLVIQRVRSLRGSIFVVVLNLPHRTTATAHRMERTSQRPWMRFLTLVRMRVI